MNNFATALTFIFFFISLGVLSKQLSLLDAQVIKKLYKFLFTLPLPIVVFVSLAESNADTHLLKLPLTGAIVSVLLVSSSYLIGKLLGLDRKKLGTLMVASGITSTLSFALPFVTTFYSQDTSKYLFLYDFGGAIVVWTFVYYIAGKMGNKQDQSFGKTILDFLKNPMLWALIGGIIFSIIDIKLPQIIIDISARVGGFVNPLILIGIGVFINFEFFGDLKNLVKIALGALIIMGLSLGFALILTAIFGIDGDMQKVVFICALAPSGSLTLPFCVEHDLDSDYASALIASTMLLAIMLVPILVYFL